VSHEPYQYLSPEEVQTIRDELNMVLDRLAVRLIEARFEEDGCATIAIERRRAAIQAVLEACV